ncbi:hypothetical protein HN51_058249 [Arachis hypogaea]
MFNSNPSSLAKTMVSSPSGIFHKTLASSFFLLRMEELEAQLLCECDSRSETEMEGQLQRDMGGGNESRVIGGVRINRNRGSGGRAVAMEDWCSVPP